MPESSPWDDIAVPGADFNVRQVAVGTAVPCFWGRDAGGACLFIVELQGDHAAQYRKNAVTVNGIDVDLRAGEPRFVVSDVRSYRVGDGFPRLMRSQLPPGIANVAYDIRLETIAPYECDEAAIFGED